MFFAEECLAGFSFPGVRARREPLAYPSLASASQEAWRDGLARLILPGLPGGGPRVGCTPGPASSDTKAAAAGATLHDSCIAKHPGPSGRNWPCRQGSGATR